MQINDIKKHLPKDWNLELSVTMNNKYCTVKLEEADLQLNDQDFKDRILTPIMETMKRTLKRV